MSESRVRFAPLRALQLGFGPLILSSLLLFGYSAPAGATPPVRGLECKADFDALRHLNARIAASAGLEAAQALALQALGAASSALTRAQHLAPWSADLRTARRELQASQQRVRAAATPQAVASEFAGLLQPVDSSSAAALSPTSGGGCDYTTGEIIAIVLGFILGIIPGIILLILLC